MLIGVAGGIIVAVDVGSCVDVAAEDWTARVIAIDV